MDEPNTKALREEIEQKWKSAIGDAVVSGNMDVAKKMSDIAAQVVNFVVTCQQTLRQGAVPSPPPAQRQQQQFNASYAGPSSAPPGLKPCPPPTDTTYTMKPNETPLRHTNNDSLTLQLKKNLGFATIIPGLDESVSNDRLFLIFGRCWAEPQLELGVTRAIITNDAVSSRQVLFKTLLPRLNAICILPNPDWLCGKKVWDIFDEFQQIIGQLRSQIPAAKIIIGTLPIEADTDHDPVFFQFNAEIRRHYHQTDDNVSVIYTTALLPNPHNITRGVSRHRLSNDLNAVVIRELARKLANFSSGRLDNGYGAR